MSKLLNTNSKDVPNRIKQSSICCTYCGKGYKSRNSSAYEKHVILCELLANCKKQTSYNKDSLEDQDIPSNKKMYSLLLELGSKYKKLEEKLEKMEEINKLLTKKKKKINMIEWLNTNTNTIPEYTFEELPDKIIISDKTIEFLLNNTFNDTFNELFSNNNNNNNNNNNETKPLFASIKKTNILYIYDKIDKTDKTNKEDKKEWQELSREKLVRFLNIIQKKFSKVFFEWKKNKKNELKENEKLTNLCDKALVKIMTPEFKEEQTYIKFKNMIYNKIKTDFTDCEFEI